jgi:mono/diheme cytochrome c family protein
MKGMQSIPVIAFALAGLASGPALAAGDKPYQVADGNKVDKTTLEGWRTWRALACERCHGARQEGLVGPSLLESMRRLSKDEFKLAMMKGRPEKGMPNFDGSKMVTENLDGLYAYLKGRADGAIQPGRLEELK